MRGIAPHNYAVYVKVPAFLPLIADVEVPVAVFLQPVLQLVSQNPVQLLLQSILQSLRQILPQINTPGCLPKIPDVDIVVQSP